MVKTTIREKMRNCSNRVASFYVNQNCISTIHCACGKPLWKSLWRMWKTQSFQQVFLPFAQTPPLVDNNAYTNAYSPFLLKNSHVTSPEHGNILCQKVLKKFTFCNDSVSIFFSPDFPSPIFCEKPPKMARVSSGRAWEYYFGANRAPIPTSNRQTGGTPCREKLKSAA